MNFTNSTLHTQHQSMSTSYLVRIHKNTKLFTRDSSSGTISLRSARNCYCLLPVRQKLLLFASSPPEIINILQPDFFRSARNCYYYNRVSSSLPEAATILHYYWTNCISSVNQDSCTRYLFD